MYTNQTKGYDVVEGGGGAPAEGKSEDETDKNYKRNQTSERIRGGKGFIVNRTKQVGCKCLSQIQLSNLIRNTGKGVMKEIVDPLMKEIKRLTNMIAGNQFTRGQKEENLDFPKLNPQNKTPKWPMEKSSGIQKPVVNEFSKAFTKARKSVGLYPVTQEGLERNIQKIEGHMDKYTREKRIYVCGAKNEQQ